jgi:formylmethanofuran dehydrogenase subunit E
MPDNYDLYEQYQAEQDKQLESCDKCDSCGNPIQDDHYYNINGELWCPTCIDDCRHWF